MPGCESQPARPPTAAELALPLCPICARAGLAAAAAELHAAHAAPVRQPCSGVAADALASQLQRKAGRLGAASARLSRALAAPRAPALPGGAEAPAGLDGDDDAARLAELEQLTASCETLAGEVELAAALAEGEQLGDGEAAEPPPGP